VRVKPLRFAALALLMSMLIGSVGTLTAHAEDPPRFVYGGAEVTRFYNAHRDPNITLAEGRIIARYANAVVVNYLRRVVAAQAIPYEANWDRVAACESGGNWAINTGNGYYGGVQFSLATWRSVGGSGYPHENSKRTQVVMAERLRIRSGLGQWPVCGRRWYG
jgi:hypothetical protein